MTLNVCVTFIFAQGYYLTKEMYLKFSSFILVDYFSKKHDRVQKILSLSFQRLDVVAWKDPGLAVALPFPPISLVLGQDHDHVSSLEG